MTTFLGSLMTDDAVRLPIIVSKWALGEPEIVLQEELTESLLLDIVLENANMTIEGVQECLAVGRVVQAGPFCYQVCREEVASVS